MALRNFVNIIGLFIISIWLIAQSTEQEVESDIELWCYGSATYCMKPYYQDNHIKFWCGDFRKNELSDESVQMVCTSPPYWGLRKYSGEQDLIWGDNNCEHRWVDREYLMHSGRGDAQKSGKYSTQEPVPDMPMADNTCSLCGAWKGAYGLEPTPEMYIQHTIEILREIRRVLRKDGVVFWNCGDSYMGSGGANENKERGGAIDNPNRKHISLKPKDLCLIPFRVAIAAQEDGWWVRSVIIWSKPNPMPESVTDRPTESHEYILMLTKSARYYWDADAVREPITPEQAEASRRAVLNGQKLKQEGRVRGDKTKHADLGAWNVAEAYAPTGRNIRTVWEFPTQPYPEAHFAVFPEKLPETCIKAATPEVGCCSKCGAPWERVIEKREYPPEVFTKARRPDDKLVRSSPMADGKGSGSKMQKYIDEHPLKTFGWQPTCKCNADKVPSTVLDPFMGAGTTLWVAKILNRRAVGYEISEEYCALALKRNRQQVMEL